MKQSYASLAEWEVKAEGRVRNRGWPGHMMTAKPYATHEALPQEQRF